ncbi:MAG: cytochrome c family protein [Nitrospinae bacterium]|nr:cytochrome c family protein [Nitrospinota bacterium]
MKGIRRFITLLAAGGVAMLFCAAPDASSAAFNYVGNKKCGECHKEILAAWKKTVHAKTFDLLAPKNRADKKKEAGLKPAEDYRKDKSCMRCHVMGWEAGGYSFEKPSDDWKGVGCEDCHGAAEQWLALHDKKDLERRDRKLKQAGFLKSFEGAGGGTCAACHYNQNSPYKGRDPNHERNWADPKLQSTYHTVKKK